MKTRVDEKKILILDQNDIVELLPDFDFKYTLYRDYRDEMSQDTFRKCMPDLEHFKDENGKYKWWEFVAVRECELENQIRERNRDSMTDDMNRELRENLEKALKEKGIMYDNFEFDEDVYMDELFDIDLDLDYILKRSYVNRNVVWCNNYDGFMENEKYEDWQALKEFVDLYPNSITKEELEKMCAEWIYDGSDLKISYKDNMRAFLDIIANGWIEIWYANAVLHLGVNGSGSPDFEIRDLSIKFDEQVWKTPFDSWTWQFDWHYWIVDVYGQVMNDNR